MSVAQRPLGRSGLTTGPLALGGNAFGWTVDEAGSHAVLDRFADAGLSLIDTADVYSKWVPGNAGGESETIIGSWLKKSGKRDRIVIATKVGGEMDAGQGLSAAYLKTAVEASLRRLQTDYIDLYQAHYDDAATPFEETLRTFEDLIKAGKVRAIGVSNHTPERLIAGLDAAKASNLPRYETLQPLYNLYDRQDFEQTFAPICRAQGIGVISFYALASGFLTGKYRTQDDVDASKRKRSNSKYMTERGLRILAAMDAVSAETGAKLAQIALAWLMAQPDVTAPIVSATAPAQMDELVAATRLTLSADALQRLADASAY